MIVMCSRVAGWIHASRNGSWLVMCRMDEAAVKVTGQYYRALSGPRDELASTSYALYTETSVSQPIIFHQLTCTDSRTLCVAG